MGSKRLDFTLITLTSYGRIGVCLPGTAIRDEPQMFSTEALAADVIVAHYASSALRPRLIVDNTCLQWASKRATFKPSEFTQKVLDRVQEKRNRQGAS